MAAKYYLLDDGNILTTKYGYKGLYLIVTPFEHVPKTQN